MWNIPTCPRYALFGGNTNLTKLYHEIVEMTEDEIQYIDVCSLYPYICKFGLFSLGNSQILSQGNIDKDNIHQYRGRFKCKVLTPRDFHHPLSPYKCNKKMLLLLCRTCADI